jgi:hypothetical protein
MTRGGERDDESMATYFAAIEETFIRLRGAPLLLSPADWQVARRWHREGVPLGLVRRALEEAFARRAERDQPLRRVQSLRYCAPAVEEAWERHRELLAGAERGAAAQGSLDVGEALDRLADALPSALPQLERWRQRLAELRDLDAEAAEASLARLDRELVDAALACLSEAEREEIRQRVEERLAAGGRSLPEETRKETAELLLRREVRRHGSLPLLSLFG